MKRLIILGFIACVTTFFAMAQDLSSLLDADVILETGGSGLTDPLDEEGRFIDAGSLPANYADGSPVTTQDGRTSFLFAPLKEQSLDAMIINGQEFDVSAANYTYLDLAMLSAPGSFGSPFTQIEFHYADGTKEEKRFGPVSGWFNSPTSSDNTFFRYTDESTVETIVSFDTNYSDDEYWYVVQEKDNGNNGNRFIDGNGYVLYVIEDLQDVEEATLGVTVGNNFVISISSQYEDPDYSTTEGFTVLANSMEIHDGFEHRSNENLKQYQLDVTPFLADNTGELYILLTDATTSNGWGPDLKSITLFTGETTTFEGTLEPVIDDSQADVYTMFQTDGNDEEKKYLYDNSGSGPSNRAHRYADGSGSITYLFDLPDDADNAKLTVDMANNYSVSLSGPSDVMRYDNVSIGSAEESDYLVDDGNSIPGDYYRFADGNSYMIYQFDLDDDLTEAFAQIHIGNQFVIEVASGTDGDFDIEQDWVWDTGEEVRDNSNLDYYTVDLAKYLSGNPENIIQFRFSDGMPEDGWGPYLKNIMIVNKVGEGDNEFHEVMNAMETYGEDIHDEYNKQYYTIDLSTMLENNPTKEVFVKFNDASTGDGWGPGIFWMAAYSGELAIQSDKLVFSDLKTTAGDPEKIGAGLLYRRYTLDAGKTLSKIVFPSQPADENDKVYLLSYTLVESNTPVADWMLH